MKRLRKQPAAAVAARAGRARSSAAFIVVAGECFRLPPAWQHALRILQRLLSSAGCPLFLTPLFSFHINAFHSQVSIMLLAINIEAQIQTADDACIELETLTT
jgi:hypothetical protein